MIIRTIPITVFFQNARVLIDPGSKVATVVDPGGEVEKILRALTASETDVQVTQIFLTHSHIDHAGGVAALLRELEKRQDTVPNFTGPNFTGPNYAGPKLLAFSGEREFRVSIAQQAVMFGLPPTDFENCPEPDVVVNDEQTVMVGDFAAKVLFTPGHSPGHLALYFSPESLPEGVTLEEMSPDGSKIMKQVKTRAPILLAGDTLFQGSIGRTDLPGGNHELLLESIKSKLFVLPDDTLVLSGHGPNTNIGEERRSNPFFGHEGSWFG